MNKPQDFDNVREFASYPTLEPGGYICKIMQIEETTARSSGAPMLKISLDIASGDSKDFFANMYRSDTRPEKKWGCILNQLIYDTNGGNTTNRGFKTFITCVENSNNGFKTMWGDKFAACFRGKLIGVAFRREQYMGTDGNLHFFTKPAWFHSVETIKAGVPVPEDKLLPDTQPYQQPQQNYKAPYQYPPSPLPPELSDFEEVISDGTLPF